MTAESSHIFSVNADGEDTSATMRVRLLGGFDVSVDGRRVPDSAWRQRRAAGIIKILALEPSHRMHREQLMDLLWPDLDYDAQLNNLRQALHHARRSLESAGMPPNIVLQRHGDIVVLAPVTYLWVDVHAFEHAVTRAWQALTPATAEDALALYGGDLLPDDRYEAWAEQLRTTLQASYLALLARLAFLHEEAGEQETAIDAWQRMVAADPTNEAAHVALMRLYAGFGQRSRALAQFDQLVTLLNREQDASPEAATLQLAQAIREGQYPGTINVLQHSPQRPAVMSGLPNPISQLIGREQEQAEVRQLLGTERLVTLTGPGGIGKTRLAIAVAGGVGDVFPDGIIFVDLAPVRDPERVIPTIANAIGVREEGHRPLATSLATALRDKRLLLVLDNVEQVVEAGRDIARLLEQAPTVTALVTSRTLLRLRGERIYSVPPLAIAETESPAVELFVSRASHIRPDFTLSTESSPVVTAICRRLDGLPLAIELAAARIRVLTPQAILDRLERPLVLLGAGASDLVEHQRTMRATIQWSYDLLDPDEQRLFTHLSVFVGGWTLEAVEAIASDAMVAVDVTDALDSLVTKSLVTSQSQPDGEIRFGMLETIREFGRERLASSGDEPLVRDRHARWVVHLVDQAAPHIEGPDQVAWLARLERESDNIRAGLDWLIERHSAESALKIVHTLRLHWFTRGRIREGMERTIAVTDLPESANYPALQADALTAASFLARELGEYQRAYDVTRASLAISHRIHDRQRAANGLVNLGFIALQRGQIDDARSLLQRSLSTNEELNNHQGIADSLGALALTDVQHGDLDAAGQRLEKCISIWNEIDDLQGVAWANAHLGRVRLDQSDHVGAWTALTTSLKLAASLDFRGDIYLVLDGLAHIALLHDQDELACHLAGAAASVREQSGITLSPVDQERVDKLFTELRDWLGTDAFREAWAHRHDWTLGEIMHAVTAVLDPLVNVEITTNFPISPLVSQEGFPE